MLMRTDSGTASLLSRTSARLALSRGAAKESSGKAGEQFADFRWCGAEIIGGSERRTLPEAPGDGADADARRLAGRQIDRAVADQQRLPGGCVEQRAESQEPVGRGFSRPLVAADHRPERAGHAEPLQDLPRKSAGL